MRHVADTSAGSIRATDLDYTVAADQIGNAFEQCRLAGRIGPDDSGQLSADKQAGIHIGEHHMLAIAGANAVQCQVHHDRLRLVKISEKKNGTPTSAVITPIGRMAPGMIILLTTEVTESISAPQITDAGR